jgi:hypothetical protein
MRPRVFDRDLDLLAARLETVGVDRRGFLQIAAGLAAMGAAGFNARRAAAAPTLAPGEKLAKEHPAEQEYAAGLSTTCFHLGNLARHDLTPAAILNTTPLTGQLKAGVVAESERAQYIGICIEN